MNQFWTNNKPTKAGWWWAMYADIAKIVRVVEFDYQKNGEVELYCFHVGNDEPFKLSKITSSVLWGSSSIPEPATRKY